MLSPLFYVVHTKELISVSSPSSGLWTATNARVPGRDSSSRRAGIDARVPGRDFPDSSFFLAGNIRSSSCPGMNINLHTDPPSTSVRPK